MKDKKSIDQIIASLENVEKITPNDQFVKRMESLASAYSFRSNYFSKSTILSIAASLLLLIAANLYTLSNINENNSEITNTYISYSLIPSNSIY